MSLGLNLGQGSSNNDVLLPELTNLNTWLIQPTTDGKTLVNNKGTDATLTGVTCADFTNDDTESIISTASIAPRGDWYVECYYYPDAHVSYGEVVLGGGGSADQYIGTHTTSGRLRARVASTAFLTSASNVIPTGEWSRIVSSRSGSNITFTVYEADGTQRWTETLSANDTLMTAGTVKIGGAFSGRIINGKLSNVIVGNSSTDTILHYPLAETITGSTDPVYDVSGNGNHAQTANVGSTTLNDIASWNHQYGFTLSSSKRVPALSSKTKQIATFDGVDSNIQLANSGQGSDFAFGSDNFTIEGKADLTDEGNDRILISRYLTSGNLSWIVLVASGSNSGGFSLGTSSDGSNVTFAVCAKGNVPQRVTNWKIVKTGTVVQFYFDDVLATATSVAAEATLYDANANVHIGGHGTDGESGVWDRGIHSLKVTNDTSSTVILDMDFSGNIGTTTATSSHVGTNHDGTIANATLSLFWGKRVVDTSGILVSADYALTNTSISNPSGYVHNNSECGLDLITTDVSASDILSINNSSATQTFVRRDASNSNLVIHLLQYSSALSDAGQLARTRTYVG